MGMGAPLILISMRLAARMFNEAIDGGLASSSSRRKTVSTLAIG
jgi:hypothetical protein